MENKPMAKKDDATNVVNIQPKTIPYASQAMPAGRVQVVVDGITPLLTHNPSAMTRNPSTAKRGTRIPEVEEEAEAGCYRLENGVCAAKAEYFVAAIHKAAGAWKGKNRSTMKSQLAHISAVEDLVPLHRLNGEPIRDYIIDERPVVVVKARIIRARPRYDEWSATFTIYYDHQLVADAKLIVDILADAGNRIGAGDYRPRFGRFRVREYIVFD
jgi:hypothetical protein